MTTKTEATSYQRLREHLAYLGMTAAAEHLSIELDRAHKEKLSATQVLESLLDILKAVDLLMGQLAQQQTNSVLPKLLKFFRQ